MPCGAIGPLVECPHCRKIETYGPYGGHREGCPRRPEKPVTVAEWQKTGGQR